MLSDCDDAGGVAQKVTEPEQERPNDRALIEGNPDALVAISPHGVITDVNESMVRLTGIPRESIVGTDFADYFTDAALARRLYTMVLADGILTNYSLVLRHEDGHLIDVVYNADVYRDNAGRIRGVCATARTTSPYARSLIEATLDPLVTISHDGKITDANEATADITGVPRETLVGTDFSSYFTEPESAREVYYQVMAKGFVTGFPLTIRHRDRALTEVMCNASVYKDTNGNVLGVFAVARDITGQRRAEAEIAEQRGRELDRLAELERFQRLTVGRELKMIELKKEIRELQKAVAKGGVE
jgi:PAS domain S-box-containing protein